MKKIVTSAILSSATAALLLLGAPLASALSVGADVNVNVTAGATAGSAHTTVSATLLTKAVGRADQEIERRIDALTKLSARISQMQRISSNDQAVLTSNLQTQISALTTLKTKIDADTDATTLKADVKSITDSYRIFMLILPQNAMLAAEDRIVTIADAMAALGSKLSVRISAAQASSTDMTAAQAALADMQAKLADAKVQATAAQNLVLTLKPDNGDKTIEAANKQTLKDARVKIQAGQQDLVAARKDINTILKALPNGDRSDASVGAAMSASTTTQ